MRAHGQAVDWSTTSLGPPATWAPALRAAVRLIMDSPGAMCLYAGRQFVMLYNDAYRTLLGTRHPSAFGRPAHEVWADVWSDAARQFRFVVEHGLALDLRGAAFPQTPVDPARAVEPAWFDYTLSPVREEDAGDEPGAVVAILNVVTETTARVQADVAIAAEREKLRTLIRHMPVPMALHVGPEHHYELTNAAYESVAGARALAGQTPRDAFPEFAASGFFEVLDHAYATGEPWVGPENHVPFRMADGATRDVWTSVRIEPMRGAHGRVIGLLNMSVDITAQVLARREVERLAAIVESERTRLQMLIELMPAPVALHTGPDHQFEIVSESYRRISGGRNLLGMTLREAYPELEGQGIIERFDQVRTSGETWVQHELYARMDRHGTGVEDAWFDVRYEPVRDVDGRVVGILNFSFDVTEQVRARHDVERLLRESEATRAEAMAANRSKGEFLAVLSHELRTPLNAIDGYAELMELGIRGPITPEQRQDLGRIRSCEKHLRGLINGVLSYAQVEAGAVHYDMEFVPLGEVLTTCEALTAPQVRSKGLTLRRQPCDPTIAVRADREKLQQIVLNLLSNAIKFTDGGGRLELRWVQTRDERGAVVHLKVADTGIGIAADHLARVFEPFVQVERESTRTREGTGLGLAISRDFARAMGGDVTVASALGKGSTFTLTLRAEE